MIVVTGYPRGGTSVVMQTLQKLGVHVHGVKFPRERTKADNDRGFWEDPAGAFNGDVVDVDEDSAVKIHLRKLVEYTTLNPAADKVIHCVRDIDDHAQAMHDKGIGGRTPARNKMQIQKWTALFAALFQVGGKFEGVPLLTVDLDTLRADRVSGVAQIATFAESPTSMDKTDAIDNIIRR